MQTKSDSVLTLFNTISIDDVCFDEYYGTERDPFCRDLFNTMYKHHNVLFITIKPIVFSNIDDASLKRYLIMDVLFLIAKVYSKHSYTVPSLFANSHIFEEKDKQGIVHIHMILFLSCDDRFSAMLKVVNRNKYTFNLKLITSYEDYKRVYSYISKDGVYFPLLKYYSDYMITELIDTKVMLNPLCVPVDDDVDELIDLTDMLKQRELIPE